MVLTRGTRQAREATSSGALAQANNLNGPVRARSRATVVDLHHRGRALCAVFVGVPLAFLTRIVAFDACDWGCIYEEIAIRAGGHTAPVFDERGSSGDVAVVTV
jgi:hypothetical protein